MLGSGDDPPRGMHERKRYGEMLPTVSDPTVPALVGTPRSELAGGTAPGGCGILPPRTPTPTIVTCPQVIDAVVDRG